MNNIFTQIKNYVNKIPVGGTLNTFALKKHCRDYYQQYVSVNTLSTYQVKMLACKYLEATDIPRIYTVKKHLPENYTLLMLTEEYDILQTLKKQKTNPALAIQIGGSHYKKWIYQPIELCVDMNLSFIQGSIVKYIVRYQDKNGLEDLRKVVHYCELAIELKHVPKLKDCLRTYIHRFCEENKLDTFQAKVIRNMATCDFQSIIKDVTNYINQNS